jgi:phosphatidylserine decarboxylase
MLPVRKEGLPQIAISAGIGIALVSSWIKEGGVGLLIGGIFFIIVAMFISFFFRDPEREAICGPGEILAPSDGKVVDVEDGKISIFLSIFDVHVARAPVSGIIRKVERRDGGFSPAFSKKASRFNRMMELTIDWEDGGCIRLRMIVGILARRLICWVGEGERVEAGQRIGMMVLGSRTELAFDGCRARVRVGDVVRGGMTIVASKEGLG